ncbi:hypothetical protein L1987_33023 [Smallanthus sonchifolius]|uniref:Uncharacterized protein n=1 Tax=Smallanthus sonchifolius TaxID=185202 RepID=A0ACB9HPW9_9ASTR|nr:hypothetical protein L1987_33023 [Smallanthus sonchifolius]
MAIPNQNNQHPSTSRVTPNRNRNPADLNTQNSRDNPIYCSNGQNDLPPLPRNNNQNRRNPNMPIPPQNQNLNHNQQRDYYVRVHSEHSDEDNDENENDGFYIRFHNGGDEEEGHEDHNDENYDEYEGYNEYKKDGYLSGSSWNDTYQRWNNTPPVNRRAQHNNRQNDRPNQNDDIK